MKKTHEGKPWTGPLQYDNDAGELMMLPSCMAILVKYAEERGFSTETLLLRLIGKLLALGVLKKAPFHCLRSFC